MAACPPKRSLDEAPAPASEERITENTGGKREHGGWGARFRVVGYFDPVPFLALEWCWPVAYLEYAKAD